MPDPQADAHTYAWNWFSLHSGQRMQLVNFWLVAVAFLAAAFVQARTGNIRWLAVGICFTGALASVAFALLDARTRRLVQVAEAALGALEDDRSANPGITYPRLVAAAASARSSWLSSYRIVIEGLQAAVAVLFLAAGLLTTLGI